MLFPSQSHRSRMAELKRELSGSELEPVAAAQRLLAVDPESADAHLVVGTAAAAAGDLEEGERLLWKGIELQPFGSELYASLAHTYRQNSRAGADHLWLLALWSVGLGQHVPPKFAETYQADSSGLDYTDTQSYYMLAQALEDKLEGSVLPADLKERLRPYWLLKELAREAYDGLSGDLLRRLAAEASRCIPVWRAVVRAWARDAGQTNGDALMLVVALIGEFAGPEVLADLWELSVLSDHDMFFIGPSTVWLRDTRRKPLKVCKPPFPPLRHACDAAWRNI